MRQMCGVFLFAMLLVTPTDLVADEIEIRLPPGEHYCVDAGFLWNRYFELLRNPEAAEEELRRRILTNECGLFSSEDRVVAVSRAIGPDTTIDSRGPFIFRLILEDGVDPDGTQRTREVFYLMEPLPAAVRS